MTALAVTADGRHVVAGLRNGAIQVWDVATNQRLCELDSGLATLHALAIAPDARWIVAGGSAPEEALRCWFLDWDLV